MEIVESGEKRELTLTYLTLNYLSFVENPERGEKWNFRPFYS